MSENPSGAVHPNVFFLAWAAAAVGLTWARPLPFPDAEVLVWAGRGLWALGGALLVWAHLEFRRHETTDSHRVPTAHLITSGPFRHSRNP